MITVTEVWRHSKSWPSQWEGYTDDDRRIFVIYKRGRLRIDLGEPGDDDAWAAIRRGRTVFNQQLRGENERKAMSMSFAELVAATVGVFNWPNRLSWRYKPVTNAAARLRAALEK
jgi:hypothetical protein